MPKLAFDLADEFGPALVLPLGSGEEISGVLLTVRLPGSPGFDEKELQLVSTFADQAALALQRAETQAAQRELEVLADRDRIARDLHDHVIQRLFAVGLALQSSHRREKSPQQAARLAEHIDQLHDVIQEIRTTIFDLQADPEDAPKLRTTLHELITELTAEAQLRTTVRMSGPVNAIPADLAQHAQAVVREAVSNAVRHATRRRPGHHRVGRGRPGDRGQRQRSGNAGNRARSGLHNLSQRAAAAGGSCTVTANPDGGTRLLWTAPLP